MNTNTIQTVMIEVIQDLRSTASETKAFVLEQAPLVVQEFIKYEFWYNFTSAAFLLIALGVLYKVGHFGWKRFANREDYNGEPWLAVLGVACIFSIFVIIHLVSATQACILITVAPRYYIIKQGLELFK